MKRIWWIVVILALLALPAMAFAQDQETTEAAYEALLGAEPLYGVVEEVVEIDRDGQTMMGTLALPDGAEGPFPIVLIFHGFTGRRDGLPVLGGEPVEGMNTRTARALAGQGIASLRIDFIGSGESDGDFADTTFTSQINDGIAALDYIESLDNIDASRIGVLGLSMGGMIASVVAARDDRVDTAVLWSAPASPVYDTPMMLGNANFAAGLEGGVTVTLPSGEVTLNQPFFDDHFNVDPVAEISRYAGPLMVVAGLRDTDGVVPMPYMARLFLNYHDGPEALVEADGDHFLNALDPADGAATLDDVITWSLAWLKQTL